MLRMKYKLKLLTFLALGTTIANCAAQAPATNTAAANIRMQFQNGSAEISNYNTACYLALSGDKDLAFVYLKKAVTADRFNNLKTIEKDTDLVTLHNDSRWPAMINAVKKNAGQDEKLSKAFFNQESFWDGKTFNTGYKPELTEEERVAGLSKFWSEAKYNFVNFDLIPSLNFDSLYLAYLPKVKASKSTLDYYKVMAQFCAQLRDGHTNVYAPDELSSAVYSIPLLRSRLIEDKVLIIDVFDPILLQKGIKKGQEIISINGQPVKTYAAEKVAPYASASTPQDLEVRAFEYQLLAGSSDEDVQLELKDASGKITSHIVKRIKPENVPARMSSGPFEFKMLKGNVAYIALNSFGTDSAARAFAKKFPEISEADAIIFDVRNNGGGNSSVGWNILSFLVNTTTPIHSWYTRDYKPSYRAWRRPQEVFGSTNTLYPAGQLYYGKPVVVLTGPKSYSAAEDFAAAFKSLKRGKIIGKATGGSTGQPLMISLPGNLSARICTKRDQLADGTDFVGKGVQPDLIVGQTVADFRKGLDTDLQAALKFLKK